MVDERESPSAGWHEVYDEMGADPDVEEATHRCPDCGQQCENVLRDVYECDEHGIFRASASDGDSESSNAEDEMQEERPDDEDETPAADEIPDADDGDEIENPAKGPAD